MPREPITPFIYLDGPEERQQLIDQIAASREDIRSITRIVPQDQWYRPRYDGLSLAATLGQLNLADNLALMLLRLALVGLRPAPSTDTLRRAKRWAGRLFQRRLVATSLEGMVHNEVRIADFISSLSVDDFSRTLWNPSQQHMTTVEKGLQEMLLHRWLAYRDYLFAAEGIAPPSPQD